MCGGAADNCHVVPGGQQSIWVTNSDFSGAIINADVTNIKWTNCTCPDGNILMMLPTLVHIINACKVSI